MTQKRRIVDEREAILKACDAADAAADAAEAVARAADDAAITATAAAEAAWFAFGVISDLRDKRPRAKGR